MHLAHVSDSRYHFNAHAPFPWSPAVCEKPSLSIIFLFCFGFIAAFVPWDRLPKGWPIENSLYLPGHLSAGPAYTCQLYTWNWHFKKFPMNILGVLKVDFWGSGYRVLARISKMPVQNINSKISARPDLATKLLYIFIPTTSNSQLCQKGHFTLQPCPRRWFV